MRAGKKLTLKYTYCITVLICSSLSAFANEEDEIEVVTETPIISNKEDTQLNNRDITLINYKPLVNNHGSIGLINNKTARFVEESSWSASFYKGNPDTRINLTLYPYDWLEATLFYSSISGKPYPGYETEDYKDKGFNMKIKLLDEGRFPALAIGLDDFAGTGYYSSEYLVANKNNSY